MSEIKQNEILQNAYTAISWGEVEILEKYINEGLDVNSVDSFDGPLLFTAVNKNTSNTKIVKLLLDRGANVNAENSMGESALQRAVWYGNEEIIKLLLDAGANTTGVLHKAIDRGNKQVTKLLLDRGADFTASNSYGDLPLGMAAQNGNEEIVKLLLDAGAKIPDYILREQVVQGNKKVTKLLLDRGADVNATNLFGESLLHLAIQGHPDEEMVNILLDAGAKVNARDGNGQSVLYKAYGANNITPALIKLLINKGANVNIYTKFGTPLLFEATKSGDEELVKLLLEKGALVNVSLKNGQTPLYAAEKYNIAKILLDNGADVNIKTGGQTIFYNAICANNKCIVQLFLSRGVDVNAKTKEGRTALHEAINKGRGEIIDILLRNNADIHAQTEYGESVLAMAIHTQNRKLVRILLSNEIDVNTRSKDGMTPLLKAAKNGDEEIAKILLDKGANINAETDDNKNVLWFAASTGTYSFIQLLLQRGAKVKHEDMFSCKSLGIIKLPILEMFISHGADINNTVINRQTLLNSAIMTGRKDIVDFLLAKGVDINSCGLRRVTALHTAASYGLRKLVENLLSRGASVNKKDIQGCTPLHWATMCREFDAKGNTELHDPRILRDLLTNGADLEAENYHKETPLFYAVKRGMESFVDFLLNNGANINHKSERGITCVNSRIYIGHFGFDVSENMLNLLRQHVIKRKCAQLFINRENLEQFPFDMFDYQTECCKEIINIKNKVIYNDISLYDVLIKPTKQLVGYLKDNNFVQSIKLNEYECRFPKYYEMIKWKIKNGLRQKELLADGERFLNCCVFVGLRNLPYLCCNRILSYLSVEDLVTLERIVKHR